MMMRPLAAADETLYSDLYTDQRLMRHVGPVLDAEHAKRSFGAALAAATRRPCRHIYFALRQKQTGNPVGVGALRDIDPIGRQAEIGLILRREAHGCGLAYEALGAVAAWGFGELPIDRVYASASTSNLAASRLARRSGFLLVRGDAGGAAASTNLFMLNRPVPDARTSNE